MKVEVTCFEQSYDTDIAAQIAARALCTVTGRVWQVKRTQNCVFTLVMEPILKVPGGADMEEILQTAFEQYVGMSQDGAEDGDVDLRDMKIEGIGTDFGFVIVLPRAKKQFGVIIHECDL